MASRALDENGDGTGLFDDSGSGFLPEPIPAYDTVSYSNSEAGAGGDTAQNSSLPIETVTSEAYRYNYGDENQRVYMTGAAPHETRKPLSLLWVAGLGLVAYGLLTGNKHKS